MRIIKRSGTEAAFDISKIVAAVEKANKEVVEKDRLTPEQIKEIAKKVTPLYSDLYAGLQHLLQEVHCSSRP